MESKLLVTANSKSQSIVNVIFWMFWKSLQQISMANQDIVVNCDILPRAASAERAVLRGVAWVGTHWRRTRSGMGRARTREWWGSGWRPGKLEKCINKASPLSLKKLFTQKCKSIYFLIILSWQVSYLDELERETEDPEGLCLLRPRGGEPMRPGLLLGDLDLRQGSFHSSGLLGNEPISFLGGGSIGPLKRKRGFRRRKKNAPVTWLSLTWQTSQWPIAFKRTLTFEVLFMKVKCVKLISIKNFHILSNKRCHWHGKVSIDVSSFHLGSTEAQVFLKQEYTSSFPEKQ